MRDEHGNPDLAAFQRDDDGFALINLRSDEELGEHEFAPEAGSDGTGVFLGRVERLTRGDKHMRVVIYCNGSSCRASTRAANRLTEAGYTNVMEYRDGVEIWHSSPRGFRGKPGNGVASGDRRGEQSARSEPREPQRSSWDESRRGSPRH